MSNLELFIIAVGLSMDAFAVSICKGLSMKKIHFRKAATVGLYFGIFQGVMPLIGYSLGSQFADQITAYDHWITFILLGIIGGKMIKESLAEEDGKGQKDCNGCPKDYDFVHSENSNTLAPSKMLPLALATSIDALAVGVSFAFLRVNIVQAVSFIGVVTFMLSVLGVKIGNVFGVKYKAKAEFAGGAILVLMGIKILIDHMW